MRERDGLCALKVRVARHESLDLVGRALDEGSREIEDRSIELHQRVDHKKPEVQGDLIVPAPARMQLPGDLAHQIPEAMLDDRVHILEVARPGEALLIHLFEDPLEPFDYSLYLGCREDPLSAEHSRVHPETADLILWGARSPRYRSSSWMARLVESCTPYRHHVWPTQDFTVRSAFPYA